MPNLYKPPFLYLPRYRELIAEVGVQAGVKACYKIQVCRAGQVIREPFGNKFIPNNITNNGLDALLTGSDPLAFMIACRAGSGTNAASNSDTALQTLLKSTQTYLGSGNGSSNDTVNGACTQTRVYEFTAEVGTVTYNEVGLNTATSGTAITTRALLPSSVTCLSGDNLRVTYSVTFSIPSIITSIPVSLSAVNGFNVSGSMKVCGSFSNIFNLLATSGGTAGATSWTGIFAGASCQEGLGSAPTSFPGVNVGTSFTQLGTTVTGSQATYTPGTFSRNVTCTWVPSNPSSTASNVNCVNFFCTSGGNSTGALLILTTAQTKANTNTLTITYNATMARA